MNSIVLKDSCRWPHLGDFAPMWMDGGWFSLGTVEVFSLEDFQDSFEPEKIEMRFGDVARAHCSGWPSRLRVQKQLAKRLACDLIHVF